MDDLLETLLVLLLEAGTEPRQGSHPSRILLFLFLFFLFLCFGGHLVWRGIHFGKPGVLMGGIGLLLVALLLAIRKIRKRKGHSQKP